MAHDAFYVNSDSNSFARGSLCLIEVASKFTSKSGFTHSLFLSGPWGAARDTTLTPNTAMSSLESHTQGTAG